MLGLNKLRLKGLTKQSLDDKSNVPELKRLVHQMTGSVATYEDPAGTVVNTGLMNRPDVAVLDCVMPEGVVFPEHLHGIETEWLLVYEGELEFTMGGTTRIIGPGDYVRIKPNHAHTSRALSPVRVLAVTMPADKGFPDAYTGQ